MHCWNWISDVCHEHNIDFIRGHALYMKAIHAGKAKNDRIDLHKIAHLIVTFCMRSTISPTLKASRSLPRNWRVLTISKAVCT